MISISLSMWKHLSWSYVLKLCMRSGNLDNMRFLGRHLLWNLGLGPAWKCVSGHGSLLDFSTIKPNLLENALGHLQKDKHGCCFACFWFDLHRPPIQKHIFCEVSFGLDWNGSLAASEELTQAQHAWILSCVRKCLQDFHTERTPRHLESVQKCCRTFHTYWQSYSNLTGIRNFCKIDLTSIFYHIIGSWKKYVPLDVLNMCICYFGFLGKMCI